MKIKAVVFDWAGTIIDHGSRAPMGAFVKVLSDFQVPITVAEARRPMGLPKWDHIKALLTHPLIGQTAIADELVELLTAAEPTSQVAEAAA